MLLLYLADRYPQAGLGIPFDDPTRGRFLQWMFFTGSCLELAMVERMTGAQSNTVSFGWGDLTRVEHAIESALEEEPWLLGEQFTATDILVASTLQIAFMAKVIAPEGVLFDYVERSVAREGYERASAIDHQEAVRVAPKK